MTLPTLDSLHQTLEELSQQKLPDGRPAFLFRGERAEYPNTLSTLDRHYHNSFELYDELDNVTAFAMKESLPSRRLPPQLAGAFAQHYGLPTQVFDFTASPTVAVSFAANRPWQKTRPRVGMIGILDGRAATRNQSCVLCDLRSFPEAIRARRQAAFGMIYTNFIEDDFLDLKRPDVAEPIGLKWIAFGHLPDDETYLHLIDADADLVSTDGDSFASVPQEFVDQFVSTRGPLSKRAAQVLSSEVPAVGRSQSENYERWTRG